MDRSAFDHLRGISVDARSAFCQKALTALKELAIPAGIVTKTLILDALSEKPKGENSPAVAPLKAVDARLLPGPPVAPVLHVPVAAAAPAALKVDVAKPNVPIAPSMASLAPSKGMNSRLEIFRGQDFDGSAVKSGAEDFARYFRSRFEKLVKTFKVRMDSRDATDISSALKAAPNGKVKLLGMVMEKRERGGRLFLDLDDLAGSATVMVSASDRAAYEIAQRIPRDQLVCVIGSRANGDLIVGKELILPDIPEHPPNLADEDVWAALISDIHAGSKKFLPDVLNRALDWLNGISGTSEQREISGRVKYVAICGDLVDGIGVYPNQEKELALPNLNDQYKEVAKYVARIPDHMELVIIPGNHDPVRQALPQPPIPKTFGEALYEAREFTSLCNPAEVGMHGVRLLMHHGRSLDDIIASVPTLDYNQPEKAMKLQLQCRHLASEYGSRTALSPSQQDALVIESVPDIFQSGHIHIVKYETYRGTLILNSGAWQAQTEFQKKMNLVPTPGILTAVNLRTLQLRRFDFVSGS